MSYYQCPPQGNQDGTPCKHGGFVFYRDDGSVTIWILDPSRSFLYQDGDVSSLADAFQSAKVKRDIFYNIRSNTSGVVITNNCLSEDRYKIRNEITKLSQLSIPEDREKYARLHHDEKTLLHRACYAGCSSRVIEALLQSEESKNLLHKAGPYGWTPLMYALRYKTKDDELIFKLIAECPESVVQKDIYDRSALHIALDSMASVDVLRALIDSDHNQETIFQPTKYFGRLPIHILCDKAIAYTCSGMEDVVVSLLKSDVKRTTVFTKIKAGHLPLHTLHTKTKAGRLPLHVAISQKMPAEVIRHFLGTNYRNQFCRETSQGSIELTSLEDESSSEKPIYVPFEGMIPLHIGKSSVENKE